MTDSLPVPNRDSIERSEVLKRFFADRTHQNGEMLRMKAASPRQPIPVSVDRVRMIRRSIRCFIFGLMGAVPLFGLGAAVLALRLRRQLAEETGEPPGPKEMFGCTVAFSVLAAISLCFKQAGIILGLAILLTALQCYLMFRHYRRTGPVEWNPARHLVYWGASLACAGLNLSSAIILLSLAALAR